MPLAEFTALLVLATAMSFTPGPNTTLSTALAANRGLPHAMRFVCAVPVGWSALLLLCAGGLGAMVVAAPLLRLAIKGLGIAYLLWLAWKLAHSARLAEADAAQLTVGFWQGTALQFVNIKAWMLALTLTAGWVVNAAGAPAANPGQRLAIICAVMCLFAFTSNFSYALMGSMLRTVLSQGKRLLWFNRMLALVLLATALWMAAL